MLIHKILTLISRSKGRLNSWEPFNLITNVPEPNLIFHSSMVNFKIILRIQI